MQLPRRTLTLLYRRQASFPRLVRPISVASSWSILKHNKNFWRFPYNKRLLPVSWAYEVNRTYVKTQARSFSWKSKILRRVAVPFLFAANARPKYILSSPDQFQRHVLIWDIAALRLVKLRRRTSAVLFPGHPSLCSCIERWGGLHVLWCSLNRWKRLQYIFTRRQYSLRVFLQFFER